MTHRSTVSQVGTAERAMSRNNFPVGELALLAGTRVLLGAGIGLLISNRFSKDSRRLLGSVLLAIGIISTLPLALDLFAEDETVTPETELQ